MQLFTTILGRRVEVSSGSQSGKTGTAVAVYVAKDNLWVSVAMDGEGQIYDFPITGLKLLPLG